jgi:hypothetical protein
MAIPMIMTVTVTVVAMFTLSGVVIVRCMARRVRMKNSRRQQPRDEHRATQQQHQQFVHQRPIEIPDTGHFRATTPSLASLAMTPPAENSDPTRQCDRSATSDAYSISSFSVGWKGKRG